MNDLLVKNIDKIISGDLGKGILPGDTIVVRNGLIHEIGYYNEVDKTDIETVVDADGQCVAPGFIDAHVHNTLDDYAPQRNAVGCYSDALYGGTTSMISEGEQGPGWPRFYDDPIGCKASAIMAKRVFDRFRPCARINGTGFQRNGRSWRLDYRRNRWRGAFRSRRSRPYARVGKEISFFLLYSLGATFDSRFFMGYL